MEKKESPSQSAFRAGASDETSLRTVTFWRILHARMSSLVAENKIGSLADLECLPRHDLIHVVSSGLPAHLVRELAKRFGITLEDMAGLLRLNSRTLQRRLDHGALGLSESERLWELSRLYHRAVEVLESEAAAVNWFKNPIQALGWATPLAYARTVVGLRELENVLGRIEHGVYS
jgi:putative toxin-antitoxin system antitoxin component (TIGR02293 family)